MAYDDESGGFSYNPPTYDYAPPAETFPTSDLYTTPDTSEWWNTGTGNGFYDYSDSFDPVTSWDDVINTPVTNEFDTSGMDESTLSQLTGYAKSIGGTLADAWKALTASGAAGGRSALEQLATLGIGGLSAYANYDAYKAANELAREKFESDRTLGITDRSLKRDDTMLGQQQARVNAAQDYSKTNAIMDLIRQRQGVDLSPNMSTYTDALNAQGWSPEFGQAPVTSTLGTFGSSAPSAPVSVNPGMALQGGLTQATARDKALAAIGAQPQAATAAPVVGQTYEDAKRSQMGYVPQAGILQPGAGIPFDPVKHSTQLSAVPRDAAVNGRPLVSYSGTDGSRAGFAHGGPMLGGASRQGALGLLAGGSAGQADEINARLSDGEYVMDADVVAALGDGNTMAGAKKLDQMRENIRRHKRSAPHSSIPPQAKSIEAYLKGGKR